MDPSGRLDYQSVSFNWTSFATTEVPPFSSVLGYIMFKKNANIRYKK